MITVCLIILGVCVIFGVLFSLNNKEKQNKKEYREKYISDIVIKDTVLGDVKCELDKKYRTLSGVDFRQFFGKYQPKIEISNYDENENELYFGSLQYAYSMQDEIIAGMKKCFLGFYEDDTEMTCEKLEQVFEIEMISIEEYTEQLEDTMDLPIELMKEWDMSQDWILIVGSTVNKARQMQSFYSHNAVAYMNCRTKQIYYTMEEQDCFKHSENIPQTFPASPREGFCICDK